MAPSNPTRRNLLTQSLALGCALAASPLLTPVTFASGPWDNRLIVIILRGGMDGLDVVQPYGDPKLANLRLHDLTPNVGGKGGSLDLDGFFALHPAMAPLHPLWAAKELSFVHAVSTPYRDKRSHFDGQDILEAGTPGLAGARDGWLNRMLQGTPGLHSETAYSIGRSGMLLTRGAADVANWSPDAALALSPQAQKLLNLVMHDDPLFRDAIAEAIQLSQTDMGAASDTITNSGEMITAMQQSMRAAHKKGGAKDIARFAAEKLQGASRIAAFSLNGFDTHARQARSLGLALTNLAEVILELKQALGPVWGKTAVLAMTEFGRTARVNGTKGTDHGTAGAMLLAGGALRGGRVLTDWPGLDEADLYQRRDLMPTRDIRAYVGWAMRGLFGLDRSLVENSVFPGVDLGKDPKLLL